MPDGASYKSLRQQGDQGIVASPSTDPEPLLSGHVAKLAQITRTLTDIITKETGLLHKRKPQVAKTLHGEKNRVMAEYRATLNKVQQNQHMLGEPKSPARQFIRKLTDILREALRDNARIILRLKAVTEGLIKKVGDEVTKQNRPLVGYGRNATYKAAPMARPTSLSLNQMI